jgi:arabinose-5-phosphate isomerase
MQLKNTRLTPALRTIQLETAGLIALEQAFAGAFGENFTLALDTIKAAKGRVILSGMGKSGHIGKKIAATLASTGTPAYFVHPAEASHGDLGMITSEDIVLAFSWSGETKELGDMINYSRRFQVPLIAVTSNALSALGKAADIVLLLLAPMAKPPPPQR